VPNKAAMEALDPALIDSYPTLGITVDELTQQETIVDLGEDTVKYVDLNAEVLATN
jgi:spermidine/putrescine transport system substrate-binding protein